MEQAAVRDVQEACVYDRMILFLSVFFLYVPMLQVLSDFLYDCFLIQNTLFLSFMPRCSTVFLVLFTLTL